MSKRLRLEIKKKCNDLAITTFFSIISTHKLTKESKNRHSFKSANVLHSSVVSFLFILQNICLFALGEN